MILIHLISLSPYRLLKASYLYLLLMVLLETTEIDGVK